MGRSQCYLSCATASWLPLRAKKENMYKEILCDINNLWDGYRLSHRGKYDCQDVIAFDKNRTYNLNKLQKLMEEKEWDKIFRYYNFKIYQPKERSVDAMTFRGRIMQHVLCDKVLRPYFEPRLIETNCACRITKGTDYAIRIAKSNLVEFLKRHKDGYVLKIDVKKYFPSIDREILKNKLKSFPDKEILELINYLIDKSPGDVGIPIGNQSSQWFALYYLDGVDRLAKEKYRIKYYVRYMDDIVIIHEDKYWLRLTLKAMQDYARDKLHLIFNGKTQISPLKRGFSFLGWRFIYTETGKVLFRISRDKIKSRKRKIREINILFDRNIISKSEYAERKQSICSYLSRGNTYKFVKKYLWLN